MKAAFIGSRHLNFCADQLGKVFDIKKKIFEFEDGISSFLEKHLGSFDLYNEVAGSDHVFIDLLSDKDCNDLDYQLIENQYQRLIWHISSVAYGSQINIVNFLSYNIKSTDRLINYLSSLDLKNCNFYPFNNREYFFDKREDYMKDILVELFGEGINLDRDTVELPLDDLGIADEEDFGMRKIINNLKSKKEFETKYEKV